MALPTFPRYLTLSSEERGRLGLPEPGSGGSNGGSGGGTTGTSRLLKRHQFPVVYPDGIEGHCTYDRFAPTYHQFSYRYGSNDANAGTALPRQYRSSSLGNTMEDIEVAGREAAEAAFADAIKHEQEDYFRRITPPAGNTLNPAVFQFSAKRAKEIGGKYALCVRLGQKLVPSGSCLFNTLDEVNNAYLDQTEPEGTMLVIGCACRFSRRWEVPRYNPLHKHFPQLRRDTTK